MPPETLDPAAKNLAVAIRQAESGGDFNARGKSGEYGAYQFTTPTWQALSARYGVKAPLEQSTKEQQNEVMYKWIKEKKDQGYNVGQIASMHNAGEDDPNAYTGKFSNGQPAKGVNKYGVHYDVPAYVKSVAEAYQTLKSGGQVGMDPNNPSSLAGTQVEEPKGPGFLQSIVQGVAKPFLQTGLGVQRALQGVGSLIGGNKEDIQKNAQNFGNEQDFGYFGKTRPIGFDEKGQKLSTAGSVKQGLGIGAELGSYLVGGAGAEGLAQGAAKQGLLKTLGRGALEGAAVGALGTGGATAAEPGSTADDILKSGATGAVTGGILGTGGAAVSKALEAIPRSITGSAFKGLGPEQIDQVLATKTIGTKASLLSQSEKAVKSYGNDLGRVLASPEYSGMNVTAEDILNHLSENPSVKQKLLDTGLYFDDIAQKMKSVVPEKASLVDKFFSEGLSLEDLHRLNSALGNNTFKSRLDEPSVRAGKDLASIMYHGISDSIKAIAPETEPIFSDLSKEYGIRTALQKMAKKPSGGLLRWRDIVPFLGGSALGGPGGGLMGALLYRAADSPTAQFATAKAIQGAGKAVSPLAGRAGLLAPLIHNRRP